MTVLISAILLAAQEAARVLIRAKDMVRLYPFFDDQLLPLVVEILVSMQSTV